MTTAPPRTEYDLIRSLQVGDSEAFAGIYDIYKDSVYTYCFRILNRNHQDAEDAVQESFIKVYENISSLDHPGSFRYWLYTIVRNHVFGRLRGRQREIHIDPEQLDQQVWDGTSPHDAMVGRQRTEIVLEGISQLKPLYREAVLLREYEQMSYVEIAAIVGSTEDAVRARLFKARKALSDILKPYQIGDETHDL